MPGHLQQARQVQLVVPVAGQGPLAVGPGFGAVLGVLPVGRLPQFLQSGRCQTGSNCYDDDDPRHGVVGARALMGIWPGPRDASCGFLFLLGGFWLWLGTFESSGRRRPGIRSRPR